jgi:hypothetical protein
MFERRKIIDALGILAIAAGLWGTSKMILQPVLIYDEGIILTDSSMVLSGSIPYRDFYTNYPPGIFVMLAALWKAFGVSLITERLLGAFLHVAIAALAGRLAGRVLSRRFSLITAGIVLMWLIRLRSVPFAWIAGLMMALLFGELALRALERPSAARCVLAGIALGGIACLRHDLFVYLCAALGVAGVAWILRHRRVRLPRIGAEAFSVALGACLPVLLVWGPALARSGVDLPLHDVLVDQVRYVQPARLTPLPAEWWMPKVFEASVLFTLIAPLVALAMLFFDEWSSTTAFVGALSLAVLPQMLGRTEMFHSLYTVTPALILLVALIERLFARGATMFGGPLWAILAIAYLVIPTTQHLARDLRAPRWRVDDERYCDLPERDLESARARQEVLDFVHQNTSPGEPIFVGLKDHRIVLGNEMELYFLADRPGATRYMQFDPNMTNRLEEQQSMIADFERARLRVAILTDPIYDNIEPNQSSIPGADLLDRYFAENFRVVEEVGHYRLLLRRTAE